MGRSKQQDGVNISCISKVCYDITITTTIVQRHSAKAIHPRLELILDSALAQDDNCGMSWINASPSCFFSSSWKMMKRTVSHMIVLYSSHWNPLLAGNDEDLTSASHITLPLGPLVDEDDD